MLNWWSIAFLLMEEILKIIAKLPARICLFQKEMG